MTDFSRVKRATVSTCEVRGNISTGVYSLREYPFSAKILISLARVAGSQETYTARSGEKRSAILVAEGEKEAAILRADAHKESRIREAQGEAEAILSVQTAAAEGIKKLNDAAPSEAVVALKGIDAFVKAADGKATKIIIPSQIQGLAGLATSLGELVDKNSKE